MSDEKNKENVKAGKEGESELSSDDLKGKKVDADPGKEAGKPAEQER